MARRSIEEVYDIVYATRGEVQNLGTQMVTVCRTQEQHGDRINELEADRDRRQGGEAIVRFAIGGLGGLVMLVGTIAAKVIFHLQ